MINIISNEIFKPKWLVTGQTKVFRNLTKGLGKIGYPYVLNKKHDYCDRLWIYNDRKAIKYLSHVDTKRVKVIMGPDIFSLNMMERDKENNGLKNCLMIQPSEWSKNFLLELGFSICPVKFWPVGIDTDAFYPQENPKEYVLIYFKQRFRYELSLVILALQEKGIAFKIIEYGKYGENDYKISLSKARYIIWLGRQESQGIAMGEALAMDIPMLVWEVSCLGHWQPSTAKENNIFKDQELAYTKAKAATYFDDSCGKIINHPEDIRLGIDFMEKNFNILRPRDYVLKNLSIEKQAKAFINLFDRNWPELENNGFATGKNDSSWRNERIMKLLAIIFYKYKQLR